MVTSDSVIVSSHLHRADRLQRGQTPQRSGLPDVEGGVPAVDSIGRWRRSRGCLRMTGPTNGDRSGEPMGPSHNSQNTQKAGRYPVGRTVPVNDQYSGTFHPYPSKCSAPPSTAARLRDRTAVEVSSKRRVWSVSKHSSGACYETLILRRGNETAILGKSVDQVAASQFAPNTDVSETGCIIHRIRKQMTAGHRNRWCLRAPAVYGQLVGEAVTSCCSLWIVGHSRRLLS
jgi:hypothetical protein